MPLQANLTLGNLTQATVYSGFYYAFVMRFSDSDYTSSDVSSLAYSINKLNNSGTFDFYPKYIINAAGVLDAIPSYVPVSYVVTDASAFSAFAFVPLLVSGTDEVFDGSNYNWQGMWYSSAMYGYSYKLSLVNGDPNVVISFGDQSSSNPDVIDSSGTSITTLNAPVWNSFVSFEISNNAIFNGFIGHNVTVPMSVTGNSITDPLLTNSSYVIITASVDPSSIGQPGPIVPVGGWTCQLKYGLPNIITTTGKATNAFDWTFANNSIAGMWTCFGPSKTYDINLEFHLVTEPNATTTQQDYTISTTTLDQIQTTNNFTMMNRLLCISGNAMITTWNSNPKPLKSIKLGEVIASYDTVAKVHYPNKVIGVCKYHLVNDNSTLRNIIRVNKGSIASNIPNDNLIMTGDHKIHINDTYIPIRKLTKQSGVEMFVDDYWTDKYHRMNNGQILEICKQASSDIMVPKIEHFALASFLDGEDGEYYVYDLVLETDSNYYANNLLVKSKTNHSV